MRVLEILELAEGLRRTAVKGCDGVNEAHFLVHEVMLRAFRDDPGLIATGALHAQLSSRLATKLCNRTLRA